MTIGFPNMRFSKDIMKDLLFNPARFYNGLENEENDIRSPAIIVIIVGLISAISGYLSGSVTAQLLSKVSPGIGGFLGILGAIGAIIGVFFFWIIWGTVIYIISNRFSHERGTKLKGPGSLIHTLALIGYGYLPQAIGALIILIIGVIYLPAVKIPAISGTSNPQALESAAKAIFLDPSMQAFSFGSTAISVLFLIWSANSWIFGIRHGKGLSAREAIITVAIPVAVYILIITLSAIFATPGGSK